MTSSDSATQTFHLKDVDSRIIADIKRIQQDEIDFLSYPNRDRHDSGHSFFQYPAMMVPEVQRGIVNLIKNAQPGISNIFDPYLGSGTSLTAGMHNDLDCYGQDINPLAVLVSTVRCGPFHIDTLDEAAKRILVNIEADKSTKYAVNFPNLNKWFKKGVTIQLSKLKRAIEKEDEKYIRQFMWVTLAEVIRLCSNDRTSTYKLHQRTKDDILSRNLFPIKMFEQFVFQNIDDLKYFRDELLNANRINKGTYYKITRVELCDSAQTVFTPDKNGYYHLLVTSPPYGDNKTTITYGQHSYLPLQWINLEDIHKDADTRFLETTLEIDTRSLGGRRAGAELYIDDLCSKSKTLKNIFDKLDSLPRDRKQRVAAFYYDFFRSLKNILGVMAPNSYMAWTVGNRSVGGVEIQTDKILHEYFESNNAYLVAELERTILNKRMPHRNAITTMMAKEKVMIFRKESAK